MNRAYRIIWSAVRETWVVVSENVRSRGGIPAKAMKHGATEHTEKTRKRFSGCTPDLSGFSLVPLSVCSVALCFNLISAVNAHALPQGGQVAAGQVAIGAPSAGQMTITQGSNRAIVNWQSFGIGRGEAVTISQPSAQSALLNRVIGNSASEIFGSLTANGQIFLVNPNGVLFGQGASVNVGGLVASSLNIKDNDFLNNNLKFFRDGSAGAVINQGQINSGFAALLAPQVDNSGTIVATLGSVALGAADAITINFDDQGLIALKLDQGSAGAQVVNSGTIAADGGRILLTAKSADDILKSMVNTTGVLQARSMVERNGEILLLGDMDNGTVSVGGVLDASAGISNGGFIETSAAQVNITEGAAITTLGANGGATGTWLIDPNDFTIAASGGNMTGAAVSSALTSTNFTISTATQGTAGGNGDIFVNDTVSWSQNTLTLNAERNIEINSQMNGSNTAGLALEYGQGAAASGNTASYTVGNGAKVNLASTGSFSTKLGSDGATTNYTIVTSLGAQGSSTGTDLQGINGNLTGNYVLGADIDASATAGWNDNGNGGYYGFAPIGNNSNLANRFSGNFDGLGHTISDLTINRPGTNYVGLFGAVGSSGTVRNLGLAGGSVTGKSYVGGLVGLNYGGSISTTYATGSVEGTGDFVGGLVGRNYGGSISTAYATGSVTGTGNYVGGLVGYNDGDISTAHATGSVEGTGDFVGGLVGRNYGGTISTASATGGVTGNYYVGGLVGYNDGDISTAYATGSVTGSATGDSNVGGLVGYNTGDISTAYATGSVTGNNLVGGLVGYNSSTGFISTAYATGSATGGVTGDSNVGGLVGLNSGTITGAYATGSVTGNNLVGGLVGFNFVGSISTAYATGSVTGNTWIGGLVGFNNGTVTNGYWDKETTGQTTSSGSAADHGLTTAAAFGNLSNYAGFSTGDWVIFDGTRPFLKSEYSTTITNSHQLQLTAMDLTANYTLADTIDLSETGSFGTNPSGMWNDKGFAPIGNDSDPANRFSGIFDGLGHTISDLFINRPGANDVGLFGAVGGTGTVRNLGLAGGSVKGDVFVGALVGSNYGTVENSYATGSVTGNSRVGGLVGYNVGSITNAYATGSVTGTDIRVGGLVGSNWGSISTAYATGSVTGTNTETGGLVGYNAGTVTNSYWNRETTGQTTSSGSDAGHGLTTAQMKQSANFSGWDISANGGENTAWRIYEGHTAPLLRSFLTPLTITANDAPGKTYDGLAYSGGNGVTWSAVPDAALLSGALVYGGSAQGAANAGSYAITANGLYSGQQGYDIIAVDGSLTIDKANATVTANSGTFTYNGQMQSVTGFTVSDLVNGETAGVLTGLLESGGGTNAGTYAHTVTLGSYNGNYTLTFVPGSLTIGKADATVTANSGTFTYNGQSQSVSGFTVGGLVNGETAGVLTGLLESGGGTNVGTYAHTVALGSYDGNYNLTFVPGSLTINKADATVTANSGTVTYNGQIQSVTGFTASGLVNGETASVLTGLADGGGIGANVGTYAHTVSLGSYDGNYTLTFVAGVLTIDKAAAVITANSGTVTYNGQEQSVTGFTVSGLVNGEDKSVLTGLIVGGGIGTTADTYAYTVSQGLYNGNYSLTFVGGSLTITPAPLTITADAKSKTQGAADPALTWTHGTLYGSDAITGSLTRDAGETPAAYAIRQGTLDAGPNYQIAYTGADLTITAAGGGTGGDGGNTGGNGGNTGGNGGTGGGNNGGNNGTGGTGTGIGDRGASALRDYVASLTNPTTTGADDRHRWMPPLPPQVDSGEYDPRLIVIVNGGVRK